KSPAPPISPPDDTKPRKRRRVNHVIRPEPGSLYDILNDHRGEALFVVPAYWQDRHAELLGVQWIDHITVRRPTPDRNTRSSKYPSRPSNIVEKALSGHLTTILTSERSPLQMEAMRSVMLTMFPDIMSEARGEIDLEIRFGNQAVEGVRVALLWKLNNCSAQAWSDPPILAFVNKTCLQQNRSKLYRVTRGPNHSANIPIESLQRLRRKRLIPKNPARDSYLVAVMLAIAQRQCYRHRPTGSPKTSPQNSPMASHAARNASLPQPEFRDIPVMIITQDFENAEFIVYSTVVTRVFLNRFAFPSKAPVVTGAQGGELNIQVTRVQIWPIFGLKQRLAQALCLQIAGHLAWDD
ncbi:hypothetical protein F5883DRAFT_349529, partial [Diaporthe sp. PMI_573]